MEKSANHFMFYSNLLLKQVDYALIILHLIKEHLPQWCPYT